VTLPEGADDDIHTQFDTYSSAAFASILLGNDFPDPDCFSFLPDALELKREVLRERTPRRLKIHKGSNNVYRSARRIRRCQGEAQHHMAVPATNRQTNCLFSF